MGSGCSAAKEVSDLVLTGDDFEATVKAVMWGRNIYHNVARFLQFQVTVNLSCLLIVFFGPMFLGESPFSAVQLLWLNLVMDTFAAFALGTEPPLENMIADKPYNNQQVMRPEVWRQILGMTLWNFLVLFSILVFGPLVFKEFNYSMADSASYGKRG
jgi:Ca2+ transporting ATPase